MTTMATMQSPLAQSTMLGPMFSGSYELPLVDGHVFIDRDSQSFRFILNYLRTGILPKKKLKDETFVAELDFFKVVPPLSLLNMNKLDMYPKSLLRLVCEQLEHEGNKKKDYLAAIKNASTSKTESVLNQYAQSKECAVICQSAIKKTKCTYSATGKKHHIQYWWNCKTCLHEDDVGCCAGCRDVCHAGHTMSWVPKNERGNLEGANFGSFYCDCGAGTGCQAMPSRS